MGSEECPDGGTKYTYSHSWQEIYDALANGVYVSNVEEDGGSVGVSRVTAAYFYLGKYGVTDDIEHIYVFMDATSKVRIDCSEK